MIEAAKLLGIIYFIVVVPMFIFLSYISYMVIRVNADGAQKFLEHQYDRIKKEYFDLPSQDNQQIQ